jgi:hypothetical protein
MAEPLAVVLDPAGTFQCERRDLEPLNVALDSMPIIPVHVNEDHRVLLFDHVPSMPIGCEDGEAMDVLIAMQVAIDGHGRVLLIAPMRDALESKNRGPHRCYS